MVDNFTRKPLPKDKFFEVTGHKLKYPIIAPMVILNLINGYYGNAAALSVAVVGCVSLAYLISIPFFL